MEELLLPPRPMQFKTANIQILKEPQHPTLVLNAEGTILKLSSDARILLEYELFQPVMPCFFSHVHGKSLYRVMRDISQMVIAGRPYANWYLWLRKGTGHWGWYGANVQNYLSNSEASIRVFLRPVP